MGTIQENYALFHVVCIFPWFGNDRFLLHFYKSDRQRFLAEESAFGYAVQFARVLLSTSPLFGVFYVLTNALQAMGAAVSSLIINLSRQGLIYIPSLFILKAVLKATGLVWAQPVADILSIGLAVGLYVITFRKTSQRA